MTKRRLDAHIPGESKLYLRMVRDLLEAVLDSLTEREAGVISMRFGLRSGQQRTPGEIAKIYNSTPEAIRDIELRAMEKLRHESRSDVLRDFLDNDHLPMLGDVKSASGEGGLIYCQQHGWVERPPLLRATCEFCSCAVDDNSQRTGRPQKYCSNACRQAAYRRRSARTNSKKDDGREE